LVVTGDFLDIILSWFTLISPTSYQSAIFILHLIFLPLTVHGSLAILLCNSVWSDLLT